MIQETLTFGGNINTSLRPGDIIYYSPVSTVSGSGINSVNTASNIVTFGVCVGVFNDGISTSTPPTPPHSIIVSYDNTAGGPALPLPGDYIMFSKNKEVNSSSIKGYYAEVTFVNNSTDKAELFSIGAEASESSK